MHARLRHVKVHMPRLLAVCTAHQGKLYICMEYACGGSLHAFLRRQEARLPEELVWRMFIQVRCSAIVASALSHDNKGAACSPNHAAHASSVMQMLLGLHHMHDRKVLHRDLKSPNVLLDSELNVWLGDLGVAKARTLCHDILWMARERRLTMPAVYVIALPPVSFTPGAL